MNAPEELQLSNLVPRFLLVAPRFSPTCPTEREGEPRLAYESSSNFFDEREARAVDFLCFLR